MSLLDLDYRLTFSLFNFGNSSEFVKYLSLGLAAVFAYGLPLVLIWMFWRGAKSRIDSIKLFLLGIFTWKILNSVIGAYFYNTWGFRDRPFSLNGTVELFFEQPQKAFPSDHAALLLAVTAGFFFYRYPKLGWWFLAGTILSSLGRITVGFHYVGDILAGWVVGLVAAALFMMLDKPLHRTLERLLTRVGLLK